MEIVIFTIVAGVAVGGCDLWERHQHRLDHAHAVRTHRRRADA